MKNRRERLFLVVRGRVPHYSGFHYVHARFGYMGDGDLRGIGIGIMEAIHTHICYDDDDDDDDDDEGGI
jgi:hypothetical protein